MSHFSVAVMLKDKNKLGEVLAPYDENITVPKYISKTKKEIIQENKNRWNNWINEFPDLIVEINEKTLPTKDAEIKQFEELPLDSVNEYLKAVNPIIWYTRGEEINNLIDAKKEKEKLIKLQYEFKQRIIDRKERLEEATVEAKEKLKLSDEEIYKQAIWDDSEYDEEGNELSTYNPNSKWDWYDIGGRFRNTLLTKITNEDTFEHNSFAEHMGMFEDNREAPTGYKWVNGAKIKDIDFNKIEEIDGKPFYTWALVDENGWYEQGTMGWWAMNDATDESTNNFAKRFKEYIKLPENQDKYLIIVDCHI